MRKPNRITVKQRVAELVAEHGSYRLAAAAVGVTASSLHHLATGRKLHPHHGTLDKLGLQVGSATFLRVDSRA